jgi:hypothetical protein
MTDQRTETTTHEAAEAPEATRPRRGPDGLLTDPEAARAEARRGWIMLTSLFVAGGLIVALAAMAT